MPAVERDLAAAVSNVASDGSSHPPIDRRRSARAEPCEAGRAAAGLSAKRREDLSARAGPPILRGLDALPPNECCGASERAPCRLRVRAAPPAPKSPEIAMAKRSSSAAAQRRPSPAGDGAITATFFAPTAPSASSSSSAQARCASWPEGFRQGSSAPAGSAAVPRSTMRGGFPAFAGGLVRTADPGAAGSTRFPPKPASAASSPESCSAERARRRLAGS